MKTMGMYPMLILLNDHCLIAKFEELIKDRTKWGFENFVTERI